MEVAEDSNFICSEAPLKYLLTCFPFLKYYKASMSPANNMTELTPNPFPEKRGTSVAFEISGYDIILVLNEINQFAVQSYDHFKRGYWDTLLSIQ